MVLRRVLVGTAVSAGLAISAAPAFAQYGGSSTTSSTTTTTESTTTTVAEVLPTSIVPSTTLPPTTAAPTQVRGNVLARTGEDILQGVVIGGVLVGAGALVVAGTRRRRAAAH